MDNVAFNDKGKITGDALSVSRYISIINSILERTWTIEYFKP